MKYAVSHLSFYKSGGAGKVAQRLCEFQQKLGIESTFEYVLEKSEISDWTKKPKLLMNSLIDEYIISKKDKPSLFSSFRASYSTDFHFENTKLYHLHWIPGLISLEQLLDKGVELNPIVWTFHDMWPFTGGCHHSDKCESFTTSCDFCPQLRNKFRPVAKNQLQTKKVLFDKLQKIQIVVPSEWLASRAKKSAALENIKVNIIPNPIDTEKFSSSLSGRSIIRQRFKISDSDFIIGYCAENLDDKAKNMKSLFEAVNSLNSRTDLNKKIVIFGLGSGGNKFKVQYKNVNYINYLAEESELADIYSSFDLFVNMSQFESFSNVLIEASAAGIPIICNNAGGMPEIVEKLSNGIVVKSTSELREAIILLIKDKFKVDLFKKNGRSNIESCFGLSSVNEKYLKIYQSF